MYPHPEQPGNGAFVMHQVEHLRAAGHTVSVVHVRGYKSRWNYVTGAIKVFVRTFSRRYDVVHVHYGLTGLCALARWRTPLVITLHGSDVLQGTLQPLVSRFIARRADAAIAVSPEIAARCGGTVIPCGVDLDTFQPTDRDAARRRLDLPLDGKIVLFPFNPDRQVKRYDIAAAAVDLVRARGVDASIVHVWNVSNDRMPLYYSAADAMVLCSDTEGSPTSVKEALACGLPVVSVDVGDVRSIMSGIDGTEICDQAPSAVAGALERVLMRPARAPFHGRDAMRRFDQASTVRSLIDVYRTVTRGRVSPATSTHGSNATAPDAYR